MQDKAFVQIGKIVLKEMGNKEPYELFIQNMFPEKENYKMIVAVFELKTENEQMVYSFENIDAQNVSIQNFQKYAYRKGAARGGDITFTTKFGDIEKKFRTLVDNQLKTLVGKLSSSSLTKEYQIFYALYQFLRQKENFEHVKKELSLYYEGLSKEEKNSSGLSLMFIIDGEERYLSDFQIIQEVLSASGTEEKSEKYGVKSEGINAICSICLQQKAKLHGFASPFKYATVDKPGMVSGFFKQANNWKNYPICTDCSLEFELGKAFVAQNLSSYFHGKAYYTIPKTLLSKDNQHLEKAVSRLKELYTDFSKGHQIEYKEDGLQKMIANEDDYFNLNLLFFERDPKTDAIKIKLMLEEIVPSRFRRLFVDAPEKINVHELYKDAIYVDKVKKDLRFSFGVLKTFFEEDFYDLIQKVFMNKPIGEDALYQKFMNVLHEQYNKGFSLYQTILKAHLTIRYFKILKLLPTNSITSTMEILENNNANDKKTGFDPDRIDKFLQENQQFLDTDAKKGVFFLGAMVKHLLNVQYKALDGSTPFDKKLKGYNLSPNDLQRVYQQAYGKLDEYKDKSAMPTTLLGFVNKYFILNYSEVKQMSSNEASFYFISGTQFLDKMKFPKEEKQ